MDQEKSLIIIDDDTQFRERLTRSMEKKDLSLKLLVRLNRLLSVLKIKIIIML